MIVVANSGGRCGIRPAMRALRRGGRAFDAVVTGIEASRGCAQPGTTPPGQHVPGDAPGTSLERAAACTDDWDHWRRQLQQELSLEVTALARMEWLIGLTSLAVRAGKPSDTTCFVARDDSRDIVCGITVRNHAGTTRCLVLTLRSGRFLGDALREALSSLDELGTPLYEQINLHALARDRLPLGASHRRGETFLYMHDSMADYAERPCLYVP